MHSYEIGFIISTYSHYVPSENNADKISVLILLFLNFINIKELLRNIEITEMCKR